MSIRDTSLNYWQVYGIRARIPAKSLTQVIEQVRAIAGKLSVDHVITIRSPKKVVYHIPPGEKIEVSSCRPGVYPGPM